VKPGSARPLSSIAIGQRLDRRIDTHGLGQRRLCPGQQLDRPAIDRFDLKLAAKPIEPDVASMPLVTLASSNAPQWSRSRLQTMYDARRSRFISYLAVPTRPFKTPHKSDSGRREMNTGGHGQRGSERVSEIRGCLVAGCYRCIRRASALLRRRA
jgi:hypothetical protein